MASVFFQFDRIEYEDQSFDTANQRISGRAGIFSAISISGN